MGEENPATTRGASPVAIVPPAAPELEWLLDNGPAAIHPEFSAMRVTE